MKRYKENKVWFYDYTADEMKVVIKRNVVALILSVTALVLAIISILSR